MEFYKSNFVVKKFNSKGPDLIVEIEVLAVLHAPLFLIPLVLWVPKGIIMRGLCNELAYACVCFMEFITA